MSLTKESITYGFAFIGFSTLLCYASNKSKRRKKMAEYKIVANVVKIEKSKIYIKGVGKYAYERDKDNKWSVLEGEKPDSSKFDNCNVECSIDNDNNILKNVVVAAMVNNKPLKLTIAGEESPYTIIAVEMP